jgi:hypothetical protein
MTTHAELGMNRTGVSTSPRLTTQMLEGQKEFPPDYAGDEGTLATARTATARSWADDPIGSVPPPLTVRGTVKAGMTALKGESPTQLIDKLGARCSYERTGVRLYQTVLAKFDAHGSFASGPTREELEAILKDELQHFRMLTEALVTLGADPTVMTPSADLEATMSQGILAVLVDPRTTLAQCLNALLAVELVDNDCWSNLAALTREAGQSELATRFEAALADEQLHLMHVRRWVAASLDLRAPVDVGIPR